MELQTNLENVDGAAFSDIYEDQLQALQLTSEQDVIVRAWKEYLAETSKGQPKYARIARVYVPQLRKIFHQGLLRDEAQAILAELSLAQTQPLSSLDSPYAYVGDDDQNVVYTDVDSYTGEPIDWISEEQEAQALGNRVAPKIPPTDNELTKRLIEEYRKLGYSENQISFILVANSQSYWLDEEIVYDDRGITSEALRQNNEEDMRVNPSELADLRHEAWVYIDAVRQRRTEWFDWAKQRYPRWGYNRRLLEFGKMIRSSLERQDFLDFLQKKADGGIEAHYLALLFLGLQNDDWGIPMEDARLIKICRTEGYGLELPEETGTLYETIDLFGDDILEELWSPVDRHWTTSEEEIAQTAERWEREIIETQFSDDAPSIQHTRAYARGVFAGLAAGEDNLNEAGFRQWRYDKSLPGALAYEKAIGAGKTLKEAWRAFWNAGRIIRLNPKGVLVRSEANNREQFCNWGLAKWKLANNEIFLNPSDRQRLKVLLANRGWGAGLIPTL